MIRYVFTITLCLAAFLTGRADATQTISIPATATMPVLPAYIARPAKIAQAPGVLILHGCEGYRKHYGRLADAFATKGYVSLAIDSLTPQGVKNACTDYKQSRVEAAAARAALAWMRAQPFIDPARLAVVGFSMGGIATLELTDSAAAVANPPPGLVAAVAYYPACRGRYAVNVIVPVLILDGDADDWTPAKPCQALAASAQTVRRPLTITTYPGATHAFNIDAPDRTAFGHHLRYDASAGADAAKQTLTFLQRYLTAEP